MAPAGLVRHRRRMQRIPTPKLSITHISCAGLARVESSVILSVTPNRGGVTDERGYGSRRCKLA